MGSVLIGNGTWFAPAGGSVPVNTVAPTISGTAQVGAMLTGTDGTWTNSPTGYEYRWQRADDDTGTDTTEVSGTSSVRVQEVADQGKYMRRGVRASNGVGAGDWAFSSWVGPVAAAGPFEIVSAPSIVAFTGAVDSVGSLLVANPASWANEPPIERQGTVTTWTSTSLTLDSGASAVDGTYVGMWIAVLNGNGFAQPRAIITGYNAATRTVTHAGWQEGDPVAGNTWRIVADYPLLRSWQWRRNGAPIAGATAATYTTINADAGTSISVTETVGRVSRTNNGRTLETPAVTSSATSAGVAVSGGTNPRLLYQDRIAYIGSFRIPNMGAGNLSLPNYARGGLALRVNGSTRTLYIGGHDQTQCYGEVGIPTTLGTSGTWSSLPAATVVYPTSGALPVVGGGADTGAGQYATKSFDTIFHPLSNGTMLVGGYTFLDNSPSFHFRHPTAMASQTAGNLEGPFAVYDAVNRPTTRWSGGWYADVPSEWRTTLNGDVVTAMGVRYMSLSVQAIASHGPNAAVFDTANITPALARKFTGTVTAVNSGGLTVTLSSGASSTNDFYKNDWLMVTGSAHAVRIIGYNGATRVATIEAWANFTAPTAGSACYTIPHVASTQLLGYPSTNPLQESNDAYGQFRPIYNFGANQGGMCIPDGTDSLLFWTRHSDGVYNYAQLGITGSAGAQNAGLRVYDPSGGDPGPNLYPTFLKVFAYDLNELAEVKAGARTQDSVKPYAALQFNLPSFAGQTRRGLRGVAYDASTQRIYVADKGDPDGQAMVHVFSVTTGGPTNTGAPTISGTAEVNGTLTANVGTWSGSPTAYLYRWQWSATGTGDWNHIAGATSQQYTIPATYQGRFLRCLVDGVNASGAVRAATAATSAVAAAPAQTLLGPGDFTYLGNYIVSINGSSEVYNSGLTVRRVAGEVRFIRRQFDAYAGTIAEFSIAGRSFGQTISSNTRTWSAASLPTLEGKWSTVTWDEASQRLYVQSAIDYPGSTTDLTSRIYALALPEGGGNPTSTHVVSLQGVNDRRAWSGLLKVPASTASAWGIGQYAFGLGGYTSLVDQYGSAALGLSLYAVSNPLGYANNTAIPPGDQKVLATRGSTPRGDRIWYGYTFNATDTTTLPAGGSYPGGTVPTGTFSGKGPINYFDGGDPRINPSSAPNFEPVSTATQVSPKPSGRAYWVQQGDRYCGGAWIETATKKGVVTVGAFATGRAYYQSSAWASDSRCAEIHVFDPAHLKEVLDGVRTASAVEPVSMKACPEADLNVQASSHWAAYDETGKRLYIIAHDWQNPSQSKLHVYEVNA